MTQLDAMIRTDDFKKEKHVPVIEFLDTPKPGENFAVKVSVGKEIPHPNKSEHFICWISLFFKPEGDNYSYEMGTASFSAHGASVQGPNTITVFSEPQAVFLVRIDKPGTFVATSYCNIHGLWEGSAELKF